MARQVKATEQPSTSCDDLSSRHEWERPLSAEKISICMEQQRQREKQEARANIEQMIKEAELGKAEIYKPPGKLTGSVVHNMSQAEMDEEFFHSSSHVDATLVTKIIKGEYVDLHKLLPKEKILHDEGELQLLHKEGNTFFALVSEKETPSINSLKHWEQAFEIYAEIYVEHNPERLAELFAYISTIRRAAMTFVWDNVYLYDCTFRRNIAKYPTQTVADPGFPIGGRGPRRGGAWTPEAVTF